MEIFWVLIVAVVVLMVQSLLLAGFNYAGPLKSLVINKIMSQYDPQERGGEIVFYGASNFTRWRSMEEDLAEFKVQNHGFGGSDDAALMRYADRALYPYNPKIVVFQTGSNDYVAEGGTDEEIIRACMDRKRLMFKTFHEQLPDAKFIVLSGLLLPGRAQYLDLTLKVNDELEQLCNEFDYLTYVDAEALTYSNGEFDASLFVKDGIHLTDAARVKWANNYIKPALQKAVAEMGAEGESLKK